jgi:hypothetical protein
MEVTMSVYPGTYKYVVEFDKSLTKGVLNGLTVRDRLHFASEKEARSWIQDIKLLSRDGKFSNFKVKEVA